jgi:hypothetical protein
VISVVYVEDRSDVDVYRVMTGDQGRTTCSDDQWWTVITPGRKASGAAPRTLRLREIRQRLRFSSGNPLHHLLLLAPVAFPPIELPIHPYVLGCLVGDGTFTGTSVVSLTNVDMELIERVAALLPEHHWLNQHSKLMNWGIRGERGVNRIARALTSLGMRGQRAENKSIPTEYRFAPFADRLALLQGLLDTDGSAIAQATTDFATTSTSLVADVQHLAWSLGGSARLKKPRVEPNGNWPCHHVTVSLPSTFSPFLLGRKATKHGIRRREPVRAIVDVRYMDRAPTRAVVVDAVDHLYVTDDFILIHDATQAVPLLPRFCVLTYGRRRTHTYRIAPRM